MSWFLSQFCVSLCGGNGLGGQCQCETNPGLLNAKTMVLTTIYRSLPPSLLVPHLCVICDIYQSPLKWDMGHSLGKKSLLQYTPKEFKQVKETHQGGLLFGVLGDPNLQV